MKIHTMNDWKELISVMESGHTFQMDNEVYEYWMGVLPPLYWDQCREVNGQRRRCQFGVAEGFEQITDFWQAGGKFYGCQSKRWNQGG